MGYARSNLAGILLVLALPQMSAETEADTVASASARITLHLPVSASLRPDASGFRSTLCLHHMPLLPYHLYIRNMDQPPEADKHQIGKPGSHCLSVSRSSGGKLVFIVAE